MDFDVVDITNLNRQHYTMKDLGIPKTLALVEQLEAINPYLTYETYTERVVPSNVERLFSGCDVVVEAFDKPDQKAMLLENLLTRLPEKPVVSEPRQKDRKVGAKPAQTRNADTRLVQLSLNIRAVAFHQCAMQLFFG